ncbi:MAG: hypothetical protein ABH886_07225 [Candidatus Desantisbacteria bacterium]
MKDIIEPVINLLDNPLTDLFQLFGLDGQMRAHASSKCNISSSTC